MLDLPTATLSSHSLLPARSFKDFFLKVHDEDVTNLDKNAGKFNIVVLIPTLKNLHLRVVCSSYKLQINTLALDYFHFKGNLDEVVLEYLPNLVKSVLVVEIGLRSLNGISFTDYLKRGWDFLGRLYNVNYMELCIVSEEVRASYGFDHSLTLYH